MRVFSASTRGPPGRHVLFAAGTALHSLRQHQRAARADEGLVGSFERGPDGLDDGKIGSCGPRVVAAEGDVVFERQMNDPIGRGRGLAQHIEVVEVAALHVSASGLQSGGRGVGARKAYHLVAGGKQIGNDGRTNMTRCTCNKETHGGISWMMSAADMSL